MRPKFLTPVSYRFRSHTKLTPAERIFGWVIVLIVTTAAIGLPYLIFK